MYQFRKFRKALRFQLSSRLIIWPYAWRPAFGGLLLRTNARCVLDYEETTTDHQSGYRFDAHVFLPGEYVWIKDDDGDAHTFRVMSVEAAT